MKITSTELVSAIERDLQPYLGSKFLTSDMTRREAAALWLRNSIVKKLIPHETSEVDKVAIDNFKYFNDRCSNWNIPDGTTYVDDILFMAKDMIHQMCIPWDGNYVTIANAIHRGRPGPGSSYRVKSEDFYHKMFQDRITFTHASLHEYYRSVLSSTWLEAELNRQQTYGSETVDGSKLSTVPKNESTSRTICIEPSLNMFLQLGFGSLLEDLLIKHFGINLSTQPDVNREMAREGSENGIYATIDLRSASDSISDKFVRWFLPDCVYSNLKKVRSDFTTYEGEKIEMKMFSSMGNGFTFPLQTLIFATLVRATYLMLDIRPYGRHERRNFSVFGDDIVCLSSTYHVLSKVLTRAGFIVNDDKSFHNGVFRESCGRDYFKGHDIRGVYLKVLDNETHNFSIFNRLQRWSVVHGISLHHTLSLLIERTVFLPVPFDESDSAGFKVPSCLLTNRKRDRNGSIFYRAYMPQSRLISWKRCQNAPGLLIAAIGGYLRNGRITLRGGMRQLIVRKRTPCWDFVPYVGLTIRDYLLSWHSLKIK